MNALNSITTSVPSAPMSTPKQPSLATNDARPTEPTSTLTATQGTMDPEKTDKTKLDKVSEEAKKLQALADNQQTSLRFSVDKDSQQVVVRVIDTTTDKLITQIPSEDALYRSKQLDEVIGRLISLKA